MRNPGLQNGRSWILLHLQHKRLQPLRLLPKRLSWGTDELAWAHHQKQRRSLRRMRWSRHSRLEAEASPYRTFGEPKSWGSQPPLTAIVLPLVWALAHTLRCRHLIDGLRHTLRCHHAVDGLFALAVMLGGSWMVQRLRRLLPCWKQTLSATCALECQPAFGSKLADAVAGVAVALGRYWDTWLHMWRWQIPEATNEVSLQLAADVVADADSQAANVETHRLPDQPCRNKRACCRQEHLLRLMEPLAQRAVDPVAWCTLCEVTRLISLALKYRCRHDFHGR